MRFKAKVCLTCGDVGFSETLVYCIKCKSCAVHRYCLPTVILRSDVDWLCDDCEPRIPISPALRETVHARLRDRGGQSREQNGLDDRIAVKKTKFSGAAENCFQEAADFRAIKCNEATKLNVQTLDRDCHKDIKEEQLEENNGLVGTFSNEANTSYTRASIPPGFEKYVEAQQHEVSIWRGNVSISREDSVVAGCQEAANFQGTKSHDAPTMEVPTLDRDCRNGSKNERQLEEKNGLVGMPSNEANTSYTRASIPPGFEKYVEAQQNEVSIWRGDVSISREDSVVACYQGAANFQGTKSHDTPTMEVPTLDVDRRNGSQKEQQLEEKNGVVGMPSNEANTSSTREIPPGFEKYIEALSVEVSISRHEAPTREVSTLDRDCSNNKEKQQQLEGKNGPVGMLSTEANTSSIRGRVLPCFDNYMEAQPIEVPIWRGVIRISREDSVVACCELSSHLSNRAFPIVSDAAKSLPRILEPDLMPRSNLWPKSFRKWGPSGNSIGLYFFPNDDERSANSFEGLINTMVSSDLAMRSVTESAELLVFASNVLPVSYRSTDFGFRENFYLWGVFKRKKAVLVRKPE